MLSHGVCDREGCGAEGPRWPRKGKLLCRWCWRAGYGKCGLPVRYRAAAETTVQMVENGASLKAAGVAFDFMAACIDHGIEPPLR